MYLILPSFCLVSQDKFVFFSWDLSTSAWLIMEADNDLATRRFGLTLKDRKGSANGPRAFNS